MFPSFISGMFLQHGAHGRYNAVGTTQ